METGTSDRYNGVTVRGIDKIIPELQGWRNFRIATPLETAILTRIHRDFERERIETCPRPIRGRLLKDDTQRFLEQFDRLTDIGIACAIDLQ